MNITLPTQSRTGALKKNPVISLFYSAPKVGKTEAASRLADNLILDLENGSNYVEQGMILKANNWEEVVQIGETIIEAGRPYKFLTVDTATELESWCDGLAKRLYLNAPMAAKKYKDNPELLASITVLPGEKGAYGPGYMWLRIAYAKCFEYLQTLAPHLILMAHIKDSAIVDKEGTEIRAETVHSKSLDLTGKLKAITCSKADAIGYLFRKTIPNLEKAGETIDELWVNFRGDEVMAGCRAKHLAGKTMKFDWDKIFIE